MKQPEKKAFKMVVLMEHKEREMFIINIIKKIKIKYYQWKYRKDKQEIEDTYEFIWGVVSSDDLLGEEANFYSMNDFDITYDKKEKNYFMSVETIYMFKHGKEGEKIYVQSLLDKFTEWMITKGYDTTKSLDLWDVFTDGKNIKTKFESIEELYTCFKFLVVGYVNV